MTRFSGQRYGTFSNRAAAEKYVTSLKDPSKQAAARTMLNLDQPAPETTMQALQRMADRPATDMGNPITAKPRPATETGIPVSGCITLELPYPPSVNHYYRSVVKSKKWGSTNPKDYFVSVLISKEGRQYHTAVQAAVRQQGSPRTPTGARLVLFIDVHPTNKARIDIDNRVKAVQDSLTKAGLWADDSLIDRLIVERKEPVPGGKCVVRIVPLMEGRLL